MDLYRHLQAHKDLIQIIAQRYGVFHIRVFGSVARLDFNAQSDIDLLVDLEPGRSLFDLSGFLAEVEALLKCPVDAVTERGLKPRIREDVIRDARPL